MIIKNDLNYFPYKSTICHGLLRGDFQRRVRFCRWFLQKHERFIEDLIVTDEAAFHMNGLINRQNNRKYSPKGVNAQGATTRATSDKIVACRTHASKFRVFTKAPCVRATNRYGTIFIGIWHHI